MKPPEISSQSWKRLSRATPEKCSSNSYKLKPKSWGERRPPRISVFPRALAEVRMWVRLLAALVLGTRRLRQLNLHQLISRILTLKYSSANLEPKQSFSEE